MVRSSWKSAVVVLALWGGVTLGQQPAPTGTAAPNGPYLEIREEGKPAALCRVLYWHILPNGVRACKVQDVNTGDVFDVLDAPIPAGTPQLLSNSPVTKQIINYGTGKLPPQPAPAPAIVSSADCNDCCPEGVPVPSMAPARRPIVQRPLPRLRDAIAGRPSPVATQPAMISKEPPVQIVQQPAGGPANIEQGGSLVDIAVNTPPRADAPIAQPSPRGLGERVKSRWNALTSTQRSADKPPTKTVQSPPMPKVAPAPPKTELIKEGDPLRDPSKFSPPSVKEKFPSIQNKDNRPLATPQQAMNPGQFTYQGLPPGSASVIAANNGLRMPVKYIPVPVVTVPMPNQPPGPPPPAVPSAPNPTGWQNAFTPPAPPPGQPAAPATAMVPTGYMHPGYMHSGYMPSPQQLAMLQGQMPVSSGFQPMVPRSYQGPMAPNPTYIANLRQATHQPYVPPPVPYANPAMDRPGLPAPGIPSSGSQANSIQNLLTTLKTALYPAQREWAVLHLAELDPKQSPQAVQGLLVAAKEDPAASVRKACVAALARMNAPRAVIAPTLQELRTDADPGVRQAAAAVLDQGSASTAQPALPPTKSDASPPLAPDAKPTPASRGDLPPAPPTDASEAKAPAAPPASQTPALPQAPAATTPAMPDLPPLPPTKQ